MYEVVMLYLRSHGSVPLCYCYSPCLYVFVSKRCKECLFRSIVWLMMVRCVKRHSCFCLSLQVEYEHAIPLGIWIVENAAKNQSRSPFCVDPWRMPLKITSDIQIFCTSTLMCSGKKASSDRSMVPDESQMAMHGAEYVTPQQQGSAWTRIWKPTNTDICTLRQKWH